MRQSFIVLMKDILPFAIGAVGGNEFDIVNLMYKMRLTNHF